MEQNQLGTKSSQLLEIPTVLETYKEVKQHVKKPTRQSVRTIDHIVSNFETEKVL